MKTTPDTEKLLTKLGAGRAYTLIELADFTNTDRRVTQKELNRLMDNGCLLTRSNRQRTYYYRNPAKIQEFPTYKSSNESHTLPTGMKYCRHCYHHLAGYVGVKLEEALVKQQWLIPQKIHPKNYGEYTITAKGWQGFKALGINQTDLKKQGGHLTKQCLDFSERKNHLGGKLGDALLTALLENHWVEKIPGSREIRLTSTGKRELHTRWGLIFKK